MRERYKVIVDMYECRDLEGHYGWVVKDSNGYEVAKGIEKTPLLGFAEAMKECEELENQ